MTDTQERELVTEGKTKKVWRDPDNPSAVLLEAKDDITAHDGLGHEQLARKAVASTTTTGAAFEILEDADIPTHYLGRVDDRTFRAHAVEMIPIEVVMRRLATGSFLKRHPDFEEEDRFEPVRVEFFMKDDTLSPPEAGADTKNDPLMVVDPVTLRTLLFKPKRPMGDPGSFIGEEVGLPFSLTMDQVFELQRLGGWTFLTLERALASENITLVDLKIECGLTSDGRIVVADEVSNDSWRIWLGGNKKAMKDKQRFRDWIDSGDFSDKEEMLASFDEDYTWVAGVMERLALKSAAGTQ